MTQERPLKHLTQHWTRWWSIRPLFKSTLALRRLVGEEDARLNAINLLELRPGQRVLNFGCGLGANLSPLHATGAEIVAVDLDKECVEAARTEIRARNMTHVQALTLAEAQELLEPESFDAVLCTGAFTSAPDLEQALYLVWRWLKPKGLVGAVDYTLVLKPERRLLFAPFLAATYFCAGSSPSNLWELGLGLFCDTLFSEPLQGGVSRVVLARKRPGSVMEPPKPRVEIPVCPLSPSPRPVGRRELACGLVQGLGKLLKSLAPPADRKKKLVSPPQTEEPTPPPLAESPASESAPPLPTPPSPATTMRNPVKSTSTLLDHLWAVSSPPPVEKPNYSEEIDYLTEIGDLPISAHIPPPSPQPLAWVTTKLEEPELPAGPEPTEEPELHAGPEPAEEPELPAGPEPAEEPELPAGPEPAEEPELPAGPEPTEEPELPAGPEPAEEPELPAGPEPAEEPELPAGPEPAEEPELPAGPEPTEEPELPAGPKPAEEPELPAGPEPAEELELPAGPEPAEELELPAGPEPAEEPELPAGPEPTEEPELPAGPEPAEEPELPAGPEPAEEPELPAGPEPAEEPELPAGPEPAEEPELPAGPEPAEEPELPAGPEPVEEPELPAGMDMTSPSETRAGMDIASDLKKAADSELPTGMDMMSPAESPAGMDTSADSKKELPADADAASWPQDGINYDEHPYSEWESHTDGGYYQHAGWVDYAHSYQEPYYEEVTPTSSAAYGTVQDQHASDHYQRYARYPEPHYRELPTPPGYQERGGVPLTIPAPVAYEPSPYHHYDGRPSYDAYDIVYDTPGGYAHPSHHSAENVALPAGAPPNQRLPLLPNSLPGLPHQASIVMRQGILRPHAKRKDNAQGNSASPLRSQRRGKKRRS